MNYGDRIRELRINAGLSQSDMSKKMGKSLSAYKLWEAGSNEPSISALIEMADYFGVTLDYLIGRTDKSDRSQVPADELLIDPMYRGNYHSTVTSFMNFVSKHNDYSIYSDWEQLFNNMNHIFDKKYAFDKKYSFDEKSTVILVNYENRIIEELEKLDNNMMEITRKLRRQIFKDFGIYSNSKDYIKIIKNDCKIEE